MHFLSFAMFTLLGSDQVIDDFRYDNAEAVQAQWRAVEASSPATLVEDGSRLWCGLTRHSPPN
jgi:hypothetical protein